MKILNLPLPERKLRPALQYIRPGLKKKKISSHLIIKVLSNSTLFQQLPLWKKPQWKMGTSNLDSANTGKN